MRQVVENKRALFDGLLERRTLDRVLFEDDASSGSWVERVRSLVEPEAGNLKGRRSTQSDQCSNSRVNRTPN